MKHRLRRFPFTSVISGLLSYSLLLLLYSPFTVNSRPREIHEAAEIVPTKSRQASTPRRDEVLVKFRAGTSQNEQDAVLASHGTRKKKQLRGESGVDQLEVPSGSNPESLALQLMANPQVEFAEPNYVISKNQFIPADPEFKNQWALQNIGQTGGQFGSDIKVVGAWYTTSGSSSTVIAVIDSGIDFSHPDLTNNQWINPSPGVGGDLNGWDFIDDSAGAEDEQGHGTAIAGIIAAQGNNQTGIAGVMWRASLMNLRVLDNAGTGDIASAVEAIDYAITHGAQVINISWGTSGESLALKQALERALKRNVVVVCSAGNGGQDLERASYYPASFDLSGLVVVAATDHSDQLASWSNWGPNRVTVAAPGTNILTTKWGGDYWTVSGTSAAAPIVTGVAGLMKTYRPAETPRQIAKLIEHEARKVSGLGGKVSSSGVVDASSSLSALRGSPNRPASLPTPGYGSGGTGPNGTFNTTPPRPADAFPGSNLPNLDMVRNSRPQQPRAREPIKSNLMCADCDPQGGGGGGGYYPPNDPNFSSAREQPRNETGEPGVDLGSRNFNWSLPLVQLAGRGNLNLNLTLYYNSLVWTRDGSYIKYNADLGSPAPGFALGFPKLQQQFLNPQTGIYAYMMVTSSGSRVELRQVGGSNVYEAQDGSYTQLDINNPSAPVVRTKDGTQFTFTPVTINNEYRCTQVKDRNGNFIMATYNTTNGHLQTISDTLGRVVTFIYNVDNNLERIRQTWAGVAHDWATFSYGQVWVAPNFGGGLLVNGPNNNYVTVLTQVSLHDGTYFTFNYNASFGQVNRINHYAADAHLLEYMSYNLSSAGGQTECPRFTERRDWAENWNGGAEAVTTYSVAVDNSWAQQTTPDGTIDKEFFATTGWSTGLTTSREAWSGGVKRKWTTVTWTQDNTSSSYQQNPRITEVNVHDAEGNRKRVTISYGPYVAYNLPYEVIEYANDGSTMLRRTYTDYNLSATYINRRIIGLILWVHVVDHATGQYVSKTTFDYDWGGEYLSATSPSAPNHAANNADPTGRANVVRVLKWDVTDINNGAKAIGHTVGYNSTGSIKFYRDALGHQNTVSYVDSFSDGVNRNTFAYPTTITDGDNFSSTTQYNFDIGAITRLQDAKGAVQTITYDAAGRTDRITNQTNGAYTRSVYNPYGDVATFSTIQNGAGEAFSVTYFDGAGRLRSIGSDLPGSAGGFRGQFWIYDNMGRLWHHTNPAEMTGSWVPTGDDAGGWVWTYQTYDWQGRPRVTTNQDGTTRESSYSGCGCAGGAVTTIRDERGRRRNLTSDHFGRLKQVEELWFNQTVASTTTYTYNARDQISQINSSGQVRTFGYDGYGRVSSRITPEQGPTYFSYFADDTLQTLTDARGATTTFAYNNRHLPTGITYGVPGGVSPTPNVAYLYDSVGNRTSMTDGLGSVSYVYNTLSELTSETRTFTGVGSFGLSYEYNLSGQLTKITNPWNVQVTYGYDKIGRPTSIGGANYAGVSSYVSNIAYRAFGLKQMNYANGKTLSMQYDNRMRMTRWDVPGVMGWIYNYATPLIPENTGRVAFADNLYDPTLDRSYDYDHVGRMWASHTGKEGRGHAGYEAWGPPDGPYAQNFSYDQFGNMTWRNGWGVANAQFVYAPQHVNNQVTVNPFTGASMGYDAAGNLTNDGSQTYSYDATGQQTYASVTGLAQSYDGDGIRVKKTENGTTTYYLLSSVLGAQVIAEISSSGVWNRGYAYLGGQMVAIQSGGVNWVHQDLVTKSQHVTNVSGGLVSVVDLDPWGGETGRSSNQAFQPRRYTTYKRDSNGGDDAMFRRYQSNWSRFSQPDPYDGAYDLTDPQSLNRYAYVQNDPVNFIDPKGLLPCAEGEYGAWCGGGGYWGPRGYTSNGWGSDPRPGFREIHGAEERLWPRELVGDGFRLNYQFYSLFESWSWTWGGYHQDSTIRDRVDDCTAFANTVGGVAASPEGQNLRSFMDFLAKTFIGARNSSPLAMYQAQQHRLRAPTRYGSGGFQQQFVDPNEPTANQVRHYVGGLIAGFNLGGRAGLRIMNNQERRGASDFVPDTNLNAVSTRHGANIRNARDLAGWIRRDVCTP